MSWDKWVLRDFEGSAFIAKRNDETKTVVIGGHKKFRTMIERVIETGLNKLPPENEHSQRGRVRFILPEIGIEQWNQALKIWQDDWDAHRVDSHRRLL
jgi:hypothetical protein